MKPFAEYFLTFYSVTVFAHHRCANTIVILACIFHCNEIEKCVWTWNRLTDVWIYPNDPIYVVIVCENGQKGCQTKCAPIYIPEFDSFAEYKDSCMLILGCIMIVQNNRYTKLAIIIQCMECVVNI